MMMKWGVRQGGASRCVNHPKPADVLMPGFFHRREAFGLCYERKAYRGLALFFSLCVGAHGNGCPFGGLGEEKWANKWSLLF